MNSFFTSRFNYCPLVWMFHSRTINNKIKHLHERFLRTVYSNKTSSFEKLLETDRSVPNTLEIYRSLQESFERK